MNARHLILAASAALLAACGPQANTPPAAEAPVPEASAPLKVTAPAGAYTIDKSHASVVFKVRHLGLSDYVGRFTDFDATLNLDPANPANTTVTATIDPTSIETDYPGDATFSQTHADSKFKTWDEELAGNPDWFNAGEHKAITFTSRTVEVTGERTAKVTGDLTFRGVTAPVTLDVTFNDELNPHPFLNGRAAVGFSAVGTLQRSAFGMTNLAQAIGDDVKIEIEAEFHQQPPA